MELSRPKMEELMEKHRIMGVSVAIIEENELKSVDNYGFKMEASNESIEEDTLFNACSISKFVTAVLALKLVENGTLKLDQAVNERLKAWKVPESDYTIKQPVTLRNLLCHQAGFVDTESSFETIKTSVGIPSMVALLEGKTVYCKEPAEVKYEPGTDCVYSDLGYCVIELLMADATRKSYEELINTEIFEPLGMNNSKIVKHPKDIELKKYASGHSKHGETLEIEASIYPYAAAAGIWCTSSDLALLLAEVFKLFMGRGGLKISNTLIKEMLMPQGCKPWSGLGVFLDTVETNLEMTSFGWGQGYQCMLLGYPYRGFGAIVMTNTDTGVHQLEGFIGEAVAMILCQND